MTTYEQPTTTAASTPEASIHEAVAVARAAQPAWKELGFDGRRRALDAWRADLAASAHALAEIVSEEMGKPPAEAMFEIIMSLEHLRWYASNANRVLRRRTVRPSLLTANVRATVEYLPYGVVGVIGPWNYPVFTPMGSIAAALAAGNTVVFKPSEWTPRTGEFLAMSFARATGRADAVRCVTGDGRTGAELCRADVNKIGFTGSTATGAKVMEACAQNLTPVLMECGGKDALIVDADADIPRAVDAAVWGAMSNAGQTCLGVERVYVHEAVADEFERLVADAVSRLHAADDPTAPLGRITMPSQVKVIARHVADALAAGARVVAGDPSATEGQVVQPLVLADVPEDNSAVTEETFGPTMTIRRVTSMDEAVELAEAGRYALGLTVFSRRNGRAIADRITSGNVTINGYVMHAAVPSLPLGGVGDSGFGRVHGADGLREFAYARSSAEVLVPVPIPLTSFSRGDKVNALVSGLVSQVHGRAGALRSRRRNRR
ncbi:aldehyde dehydrogenase family protein [Dietzia alimentaria]|uniref:aldehyde dehydrogenase family protein n=1 Tax=Dietzia alimentaria TaxID=665550 RepID=UPI00029B34EB|nr:aldehyde dehydrogenase family protein [Dietzia alimentaria]